MLQSILGDESQPNAATSSELRDFFLEKKKKGRRERSVVSGHHKAERRHKAALLRRASEVHVASRSLQPCRLTRVTLISPIQSLI